MFSDDFCRDIFPYRGKCHDKSFFKKMVLIEIFLINVTTKVSKRTEMPKCKKRKLFGMSRQCKTPSKVAHVIRTLSFTCTVTITIFVPFKNGFTKTVTLTVHVNKP